MSMFMRISMRISNSMFMRIREQHDVDYIMLLMRISMRISMSSMSMFMRISIMTSS